MAFGLFTIGAAAPFAESLAQRWFEGAGRDPLRTGDGLILVPTRRFARTLAESFLRISNGAALLLPRIEAIAAPDETGLALDAGFDLPPAIDPVLRLAALAGLILNREGSDGAPTTADRAWALAVELANLLDEAGREGVELAEALPRLAPASLATHWQVTLGFLTVVTREWPARLAALGQLDPARRHAMLLATQARAWEASLPAHPVWLAGQVAPTEALAGLARTIARLPRGEVILPGLDLALDAESWDAIEPSHPQWGMRRLLERLDATRADVTPIATDAPVSRENLFRRALLPAAALARAWRAEPPPPTLGLSTIEASDQQSEAVAIAMALRHAVETPGRRAALVTPDRALAARVAAEIARFGIVADDSAGEPLADTPPAVLLRLLARAAASGFAPAVMLGALKHPLATWGLEPSRARREARTLERAALRGPRPKPGIGGLRARGDATCAPFLDRLAHAFAPLTALLDAGRPARPQALFEALLETAERAAGAPPKDAPPKDAPAKDAPAKDAPLWDGEEGEALASRMAAVTEALALLPPGDPAVLPSLLDAVLAGVAVHGRRALRGGDALEIHPRVAIWGLIEARGQSADLLVLGGLTEGTWPAQTDPGPWMGRHMRAEVGFPPADAAVGEAAHDLVTLACAAPEVILSWPRRRDRAPAVPSRWIARLEACLHGHAAPLAAHPARDWALLLDQPAGAPRPARPPMPRPPVAARPRRLSVTAIETWLTDPYAIYARYILGLPELAAIEEEADHALFGTVVHDGLQAAYEHDALDADGIAACLRGALGRADVREAVACWWRPRLERIASWVADVEARRRADGLPRALATEVRGRVAIDGPAGPFTLTGRADRIELAPDGTLTVLDYKTGTPPPKRDIEAGWAPQLPLEAAMAAQGAFGEVFRCAEPGELAHWKLSGTLTGGEALSVARDKVADVVAAAWSGLEQRVEKFDDPSTPYPAQPIGTRPPRFAPYANLARVAEWRLLDDSEGSGGNEG